MRSVLQKDWVGFGLPSSRYFALVLNNSLPKVRNAGAIRAFSFVVSLNHIVIETMEAYLKTIRLFRLLLDLCPEQHFKTAEALGLTPMNTSKLANGITNRPKSLKKAAEFFSRLFGVEVDADLLTTELDAKTAIALAVYIRSRRLKGAA
jgi:hypothetical protein